MLTGTLPAARASTGTWREQIRIVDDDTGQPLDLTGCTFNVHLSGPSTVDDYGWWGSPCRAAVTTTVLAPGTLLLEAALGGLGRGAHDLAGDATRDGVTLPLFRFTLPIRS